MKMRDPKQEKKARRQLRKMLRSLSSKKWFDTYFNLGAVKARKVLADGTVVSFSVAEPTRSPARKEPKKLPAKALKTAKGNHAPEARPS